MFRKAPPSIASGKDAASDPAAQRRFVRATVDLDVRYRAGDDAVERTGRITDLSLGGVRLVTREDLPSGTPVALQFALPALAIAARGRIVLSYFDANAQRFGHGVAFTAIEPAQRTAIEAFVREAASA